MPTPAVGEDIQALCGRCGLVWHVVMAKVGDHIAKVVCKRCGGHHRYRTEANEADTPAASSSSRPRRITTRRPAEAATPAPIPEFDPSKPPRPYSAKDSYSPGERVSHPSFGIGVVTSVPGPGKVEVVFPGAGARVLACAKAQSTLVRPSVTDAPIADRPPSK